VVPSVGAFVKAGGNRPTAGRARDRACGRSRHPRGGRGRTAAPPRSSRASGGSAGTATSRGATPSPRRSAGTAPSSPPKLPGRSATMPRPRRR